MRKLLWIGWGTAVLGCVLGLWYLLASWPATNYHLATRDDTERPAEKAEGDGGSEPSDVVELLVVDGGVPASVPKPPPTPDVPMPRVVLTPNVKQPPRPDAETDVAPRMPNADEKVGSGPPRSENVEVENPAEQSEPEEPKAPAIDPHEQHCPYMGRCPAPYPYRTPPR